MKYKLTLYMLIIQTVQPHGIGLPDVAYYLE